MEENSAPKLTQEQTKRYELAISLTKAVFKEMEIGDASEYQERKYSGFSCHLYKTESERDAKIYAEIGYELGIIKLEFSLVLITHHIIEFLEKMLSNENASEVLKPSVIYELKKRNIDILTLFGIGESEVQEQIEDKTKRVLELFINNIAMFTRISVVDALGHSVTGYYQHVIKELLKEHWTELGLPRNFSLLTQTDLDEIRKYNVDRKRWFLGDKKQLLNDLRFERLADEDGELKKQYKTAKVRYIEAKRSFESLNRNASREDWLEKWFDLRMEEFPTLSYKALDLIEEKRPFELAIIHLADLFGYDEETMRRKITQSRNFRKQKEKNR